MHTRQQEQVMQQFSIMSNRRRAEFILSLPSEDREWLLKEFNVFRFVAKAQREQLQHGLIKVRMSEFFQLFQALMDTPEAERADFLLALPEYQKEWLLQRSGTFEFVPEADHLRLLNDESFMRAYVHLVFDYSEALQFATESLQEVMRRMSFEALLYLGSEEFMARRFDFDDYPDGYQPDRYFNVERWQAQRSAVTQKINLPPSSVLARHLQGQSELMQAVLLLQLVHCPQFEMAALSKGRSMASLVFGEELPRPGKRPGANFRYAVINHSQAVLANKKRLSMITADRIRADFVESKVRDRAAHSRMMPVAVKKTVVSITSFLEENASASPEELLEFLLDQRQAVVDHHSGGETISLERGEKVATLTGTTMEKINRWIVSLLNQMVMSGMPLERLYQMVEAYQAKIDGVQVSVDADYQEVVAASLLTDQPSSVGADRKIGGLGYALSSNPAGRVGASAANAARIQETCPRGCGKRPGVIKMA